SFLEFCRSGILPLQPHSRPDAAGCRIYDARISHESSKIPRFWNSVEAASCRFSRLATCHPHSRPDAAGCRIYEVRISHESSKIPRFLNFALTTRSSILHPHCFVLRSPLHPSPFSRSATHQQVETLEWNWQELPTEWPRGEISI